VELYVTIQAGPRARMATCQADNSRMWRCRATAQYRWNLQSIVTTVLLWFWAISGRERPLKLQRGGWRRQQSRGDSGVCEKEASKARVQCHRTGQRACVREWHESPAWWACRS